MAGIMAETVVRICKEELVSVLIETGKSTSKFDWLGWTWKLEAIIFESAELEFKQLGEVSWMAMVDGYVVVHDDVNGRFEVVETGVVPGHVRIVGETGSPLEAMRLARLDHRAQLTRAEGI